MAATNQPQKPGDAPKPADPPAKSDAAPHPLAATTAQPAVDASAAPQPDPTPNGVGPIPAAPPAPPAAPPPAAPPPQVNPSKDDPEPPAQAKTAKGGKVVLVWAQPGHETIGVGQVLRLPKEQAEQLRSAGRARYASDAEVKLAGDRVKDFDAV